MALQHAANYDNIILQSAVTTLDIHHRSYLVLCLNIIVRNTTNFLANYVEDIDLSGRYLIKIIMKANNVVDAILTLVIKMLQIK